MNYLPNEIKFVLVKFLIFPYFTYCNSVLNAMTALLGDKLQLKTTVYNLLTVYEEASK